MQRVQLCLQIYTRVDNRGKAVRNLGHTQVQPSVT